MKVKILHLIMIMILSSCATLVREVREPNRFIEITYENVEFQPSDISLGIRPDFYLSVKPIDATEIDSVTTIASRRTGAYEMNIVETYTLENEPQTRKEKMMVEISKRIIGQMNDNEIPIDVGTNLINRIWRGENAGFDGSEVITFTKTAYTSTFNPYFHNNNYLSVFELNFTNNSKSLQTFFNNQFQVVSDSESLRPYNTNSFISRFNNENNRNKQSLTDNVIRYNLSETLTIAPNQNIKKYISVPAINKSSSNVEVQFIDDNVNIHQFNFNVKHHVKIANYTLTNFKFDSDFFWRNSIFNKSRYDDFLSIKLQDGRSFALKNNSFYIPQQEVDQIIYVCHAAISSTSAFPNRLLCTDINLSNYEDGIIE